jgi:hypothetical protein
MNYRGTGSVDPRRLNLEPENRSERRYRSEAISRDTFQERSLSEPKPLKPAPPRAPRPGLRAEFPDIADTAPGAPPSASPALCLRMRLLSCGGRLGHQPRRSRSRDPTMVSVETDFVTSASALGQ